MFVNQELVEVPNKIIARHNAASTALIHWKVPFQVPVAYNNSLDG
jgi:hypothetical protein